MCVDAPVMAFYQNAIRNLVFTMRPTRVTHTNDVSIHFQTFKDQGVIFATSNSANSDYMKAYIDGGHVYVDIYIEGAGREVSSLPPLRLSVAGLELDPCLTGRLGHATLKSTACQHQVRVSEVSSKYCTSTAADVYSMAPFYAAPQRTFALPGKTGKHENCIFH